ELKPFEIYDRNYGKDDPNYMFPDEYKPFIVGTLPHSEIDKAYKGYNYAINLNSIKQSQTMFARRVYELLSSNTITISNFSRGVRLLFGDLVFTSDSGQELIKKLKQISSDETVLKKFRLLALRKVLSEHTYTNRLAYIVSKITNTAIENTLPNIAVVVYCKTKKQLDDIEKQYKSQSYAQRILYVVAPKKIISRQFSKSTIVFIDEQKAKKETFKEIVQEDWIAVFSSRDYYGENYITDLALATLYSDADVIGKSSYFAYGKNSVNYISANMPYTKCSTLMIRMSLAKKEVLKDEKILDTLKQSNDYKFDNLEMLSIDEFNYCFNGIDHQETVSQVVDDLGGIDKGIGLNELLEKAENIEPLQELEDKAPMLNTETLSKIFKTTKNKSVEFQLDGTVFN
ncbi:MAG: glycosyltransferase family 1 protein, partial [Campylobacterales bacterium]|nr:glycosyltransferase family 1 protein [Campylobacterales bacterium]